MTGLVEQNQVGLELGNLSPLGVLIYSKEPLLSEKRLRLFITAPDQYTLQAEGSVAWSASGAKGEHGLGYRAGIRFTDMAADDHRYLIRFLTGKDKPGRWRQSKQLQVTSLLALLLLVVLTGILYFNLNTRMNDISKNVLPRVETALQKVEERTAPLVTLQEDIDTMARIRQETNDARRDIAAIVEKINSIGADGAGEIASLGEGVSGWQAGDRVVINANLGCGQCHFCLAGQDNRCVDLHLLGETIQGTYAEFVSVPVRNLYKLPDGFDFTSAAAAGLVYHTAWHSLITRGRLRAGEPVLIVGASGGVNTACIAIAKFAGAKVIVIGSSKEKLVLAQFLGADVLIDQSQEVDWPKSVSRSTGRTGAINHPPHHPLRVMSLHPSV